MSETRKIAAILVADVVGYMPSRSSWSTPGFCHTCDVRDGDLRRQQYVEGGRSTISQNPVFVMNRMARFLSLASTFRR